MAQPTPLPELPENVRDLADQRARVRAMLDRWAGQEVSDEPDWDVTNLRRTRFQGRSLESPDAHSAESRARIN
jgi:hypothetical protein